MKAMTCSTVLGILGRGLQVRVIRADRAISTGVRCSWSLIERSPIQYPTRARTPTPRSRPDEAFGHRAETTKTETTGVIGVLNLRGDVVHHVVDLAGRSDCP